MSVNLLPQVTEKETKKSDSSVKGVVLFFVWVGVLTAIFVLLFFYRGLENGRLKETENEKTVVLGKISALGPVQDDYYTLAYKSIVLSNVKTEQYIPSTIGDYIRSNIENRGVIYQYRFNADGEVQLQVKTNSYHTAVQIWHDLLKDKSIMSELNLNSFSRDDDGQVFFQLKGTLNLEELYRENGR